MKILVAFMLCWIVSAQSVRVIDGDTFVASIDVWPGLTATGHIRVLDVDTPEMKGETRPAAEAARAFTQKWLDTSDFVLTIGCGRPPQDSFGRYLAVVTRGGRSLADELKAAGHVKQPQTK